MAKDEKYIVKSPKTTTGYKKYSGAYKRPTKKEFQQAFDKINEDQKILAEQVKQLIVAYHNSIRLTDAERYTVLQQKFKEMCSSMSSQGATALSKNIAKYISKYEKLTTKQKNEIENAIKDTINEGISKQIENGLQKVKEETKKNTDKNGILSRYQNLLGNQQILNTITFSFSKTLLGRIDSDKKYILSEYINKFKRKHIDLFHVGSKNYVQRMSFTQIMKRNPQSDIFIKYNIVVSRIFKAKILKMKPIEFEKLQRRVATMSIGRDLVRLKKKYRKIIDKGFHPLKSTQIWYRKFKKNISKKIGNLSKEWKTSSKWDKITGVASIINGIGTFFFKLFKTTFKLGFKLLQGIYNIGIKVLTSAISLIKNIVSLSFKILKTVAITANNIFGRIKLFLFSPIGAYITGFVIGYIIEKIKQHIPWLLETTKNIVKKIKDKLIKIDERWSTVEVALDEDGNVKIIKSPYLLIKEKLIQTKNKIDEYLGIIFGDSNDKWNVLKEKLNSDTGYADMIIDMELRIFSFTKDIQSGQLQSYFTSIKDVVPEILTFFQTIQSSFSTGVGYRTITATAKKGFYGAIINGLATILGAVFPLWSPVVGGVAGVLNGLIGKAIDDNLRNMAYTGDEAAQQLWMQKQWDLEDQEDTLTKQKNDNSSRIRQLDYEIELLEKRNDESLSDEIEEKREQRAKLSSDNDRITEIQSISEKKNRYESLLNKVNENFIATASPEELLKYIENPESINTTTKLDDITIRNSHVRDIMKAKASYVKNSLLIYLIEYLTGTLKYEGLKANLKGVIESANQIKTIFRKNGYEKGMNGPAASIGEIIKDLSSGYENNRTYLDYISNTLTNSRNKKEYDGFIESLRTGYRNLDVSTTSANKILEGYIKLREGTTDGAIANDNRTSLLYIIQEQLKQGTSLYRIHRVLDDYISGIKLNNKETSEFGVNYMQSSRDSFTRMFDSFNKLVLPQSVDTNKNQEILNSDAIDDEQLSDEYNRTYKSFESTLQKYNDKNDLSREIGELQALPAKDDKEPPELNVSGK